MGQPQQIINESTPPLVPPNIQPPISLKKSNKGPLAILLMVLGLILAGCLVYAGYKLGRLYREPAKAQRIDCQSDSDCVLVTNKKDCCSCPTPVNKEELEKNKDLIKWPKITLEVIPTPPGGCKNVVCSPCPWWNKAICESGVCKGAADLSPTPSPFISTPTPDLYTEQGRKATAGWKTYTNTKYGFLIKYPTNFEFLESALMGDFIVDFTWIKENIGHKPGISIRVINTVGPAWISVRDYFEKQFLNKDIGVLQGDKGKTTILEKTSLDGAEAVKQVEEAIPGAGTENFYALCVYAYKNNRVHKLCNYAVDRDTALKNEEIFDQILSTFRFD